MGRNRRGVATTNLSFIDAMSVGLGAAILLFMILHHATEVRSTQKHHAIAENVSELEDEVLKKRQAAEQQAAALERTEQQLRAARARAQALRQELQVPPQDDESSEQRVEELQARVKELQERVDKLRSSQQADAVRAREGEGRRQYLTGMDVRGRRILVLMDTSASMLDETLVNVILRRNRSEAIQKQSPKWRWALEAVDWLSTQIPESAQFQIYSFNTQVESVVEGTTGQWLTVGDGQQLNTTIRKLRERVPKGGTSLARAFEAATKLSPQPDNIYLLTDGLPTQGNRIRTGTVRPSERMDYFNQAVRRLPRTTAVHVMLFPMEGDASAAGAFWQLARNTDGSFITPSRDWP